MKNESNHKSVYKTSRWLKTRQFVIQRDHGICQMCNRLILKNAEVDHIIELNDSNFKDESIAYGFENLRTLCHDCHNKVHNRFKEYNERSIVDLDLSIDYERR